MARVIIYFMEANGDKGETLRSRISTHLQKDGIISVSRLSCLECRGLPLRRGFAKQAWEVLNQFQTQAIRFEVMQNSKRVASIVPVAPPRKATLAELDSLFAILPRLGEDEVEAFEQDIKMAMNQLKGPTELWE